MNTMNLHWISRKLLLNVFDTSSETFSRYQILPIPVPRLFSGTNFFRYRFRYHQKNEKFPIPGIPGTWDGKTILDKKNVPFRNSTSFFLSWWYESAPKISKSGHYRILRKCVFGPFWAYFSFWAVFGPFFRGVQIFWSLNIIGGDNRPIFFIVFHFWAILGHFCQFWAVFHFGAFLHFRVVRGARGGSER